MAAACSSPIWGHMAATASIALARSELALAPQAAGTRRMPTLPFQQHVIPAPLPVEIPRFFTYGETSVRGGVYRR